MNVLKRVETLERDIARLKMRTTVGGGGVPPSGHAATHGAGGTDPIDLDALALQGQITIVLGNGVDVIATGEQRIYVRVFSDIAIDAVRAYAYPSGSIEVDIWAAVHASFTPVLADSIVASAPVSIVTDVSSEDLTLTGWSPNLTKGMLLEAYVNSVTDITRAVIHLSGVRAS